jgi:hypothetical protein
MPVSGVLISETTVQHVTRDDILDDNIKAQVDAFNKQLDVRLDNKNFLLMPGSETMFRLDEYDGFHSPAEDSAYGDNTPTDDQYGSMAKEYVDLKEDPDSVMDEPDTYNKHISVQIPLDKETNNGGDLATVTK